MAVAALISIGAVVLEIALPPYLIINLHAPVWLVGLLFALNTGMIVLLQVPATRAVTSWRRTRILAAGAVGYAFSFLLFAAAPLLPSNAIALYLCGCMLVYTVAEIIFVPTFAAITAALIPIGMQGRYLAIFQLSRASAATITPAVSGSLLALAPQGLWLLLALLTFGTLALLRRLERRLPGVGCRLSAH
jgi:MFS family permease